MSTENKNCAPRLRFPGFTEEWEIKKLGEVGSFIRGLSYNNSEVTENSSDTLVIRSNNIVPDSVVDCYNGLVYVSKSPSKEQILKKGDVVICLANGSSNLVGKSSYFDGNYNGNATVGAFCGIFRSALPICKYLVQTSAYMEQISLLKQGGNGALANLYGKDILELEFPFPSPEEQDRIVEFLTIQDELISSQKQNVDALKEEKKGLMQKLFPLNGEKKPRLRFPGFKGDWAEMRFSDLYVRHIVKNDLSFGVDKIISVANMYYKTDAKVGDDDYMRSYNIFRFGDIAFEGNKSANYAFGRFVENTIGDGIVSHVFDVYSPISNDHCLEYWRYAINYEPFMRPILEKSTKKTTMMTNLVSKDFLKQTILVPSLDEQKKIAECLTALDDQIAAESAKLEALKDHKKGLMQQLFPQPAK